MVAYVYTHGEGSRSNPYQIWTAEDLNGVRDHLGSEFIQMADIDLSVYEDWEPIGTLDFDFLEELVDGSGDILSMLFPDVPMTFFHGFYDGNGYKITNLKIRTGIYVPSSNVSDFLIGSDIDVQGYIGGLFGFVINEQLFKSFLNSYLMFLNKTNVEIRNVTLENVDIRDVDAGASLAVFVADGHIRNCSSSGTVLCSYAASGLVLQMGGIGYTGYPELSNSYSSCSVRGQGISGFALSLMYVNITNCYSNAYLTVNDSNDDYVAHAFVVENYGNEGYSCYYNETKTGFPEDLAEPLTTAEMKRKSSYEGWDFDNIWQISGDVNQGYPYLLPLPAPYKYSKGSGESFDPYVVETPEDLYAVRDHLTSVFVQTKDIDLSCYDNWVPINDPSITLMSIEDFIFNGFNGRYDGAGYEIQNMNYIGGSDLVSDFTGSGLFGIIGMRGEVCNVRMKGAKIDTALVGGMIAGYALGSVYNCSAEGQIINTLVSGGIIGTAMSEIPLPILSSSIENCCTNVDISFDFEGLTHYYYEEVAGEVIEADAEVMINRNGVALGGIVAFGGVPITNCYSTGNIDVLSYDSDNYIYPYIGGIAANMYYYGNSAAISCYYDAEKTGIEDNEIGIPLSTDEMKNISTYEDWDFTKIWGIDPAINDGYPYLKILRRRHKFAQGKGTKNNPFVVRTPEDLDGVRDYTTAYFIQAGDIDMSGWDNWDPIITYSSLVTMAISLITGSMNEIFFTGHYDGNGYKVSNLKCINETPASLLSLGGLFGVLWDPATVENVSLENMYIDGFLISGGITALNFGTIKKCSVSGNILAAREISIGEMLEDLLGGIVETGEAYGDLSVAIGIAGGIAGIMLSFPPIIKHKAVVENCSNTSTIKVDVVPGSYNNSVYGLILGGIAAASVGSSITNCYSAGDVELPPGVEPGLELGPLDIIGAGYVEDDELEEQDDNIKIEIVMPANIANTETSVVFGLIIDQLPEAAESVDIPDEVYEAEDLEDIIDALIDSITSDPDYQDELEILEQYILFMSRAKSCYYNKDKTSVPSNRVGKGRTTEELKSEDTYEGWDFNDKWSISPSKNNGQPYIKYVTISIGGSDGGNNSGSLVGYSTGRVGNKTYKEPGSYVTIITTGK